MPVDVPPRVNPIGLLFAVISVFGAMNIPFCRKSSVAVMMSSHLVT